MFGQPHTPRARSGSPPTHTGQGSRRGVAAAMRWTWGRACGDGCLGGDEAGEGRAGPPRDDGSPPSDVAWRFERSESSTRGSRRGRRARSRRSLHSLAFLLCALLTLTSATRAESPEDVDDGAAEGAVAVRALAPERGFVTGGLRVAVHGAGFTDALACQFGPRVVAPASINERGTRMLCVAPPFTHALGGFVRVGVAVRGGGGGAAASAARGALTFAYEAPPRLTSVAPRSFDAAGGELMWITGVDTHVATACAFEPRPRSVAEKRFVSSALGACEAPARPPGEGAVVLVARIDRPGATGASGDAGASGEAGATDATDATDGDRSAGEVAGLPVVARRPGETDEPDARALGADPLAAREARRAAALRAAAVSADETSPANAPAPVAIAAVPREGPARGGAPVFAAGADLSFGAGAPAFCAFRFGVAATETETGFRKTSFRDTFAAAGVVVSSALVACERPPAPAWAGALAARLEVGSPGLGWSASGTAVFAPRFGAAVTRVAPRKLPAGGGAETHVFGASGSRRALGAEASCRFGTIGPVAGAALGAEETRCVSPAAAPRRGVRVYGPDPEASGSFFGAGAGTTVRIAEDAVETNDATRAAARATTTVDRERRRSRHPIGVAEAAALARLDASASALAAGAAVTRLRRPESVPAEFGGLVTLEGVFPAASGAVLETFGTQITCRFGSVAVLGRRIDGASAECAAPSAAPGAKRVAVDGAAGAVALEYVASVSPRVSSSEDIATRDGGDGASMARCAPETRGARLVHYAGGSDVFAGTRGFVQFEPSEAVGASASRSPSVATWCAFDSGAMTRARFVSSVLGTCDAPTRTGASSALGGARTTAVVERFALASTGERSEGCDETRVAEAFASARRASFALRSAPPVVADAAPSVVATDGGATVSLFGDGLFDEREGALSAPSLAWCRFGSLGPVLGRREDDDDGFAAALACVAPARAPSRRRVVARGSPRGVPVTAFDAFHASSARVAFRDRRTSSSSFAAPSAVFGDAAGRGSSTVTVHHAARRAPSLVAAGTIGPAFDVSRLGSEKGSSSAFVGPIRFAPETARGPAVSLATPSVVAADGGTVARLAGRSFARAAGDAGPGGTGTLMCVFLDGDAGDGVAAAAAVTTAATAFSSALAACEAPAARGKPSDALGGRVDVVGDGGAGGAFASGAGRGATAVRGASFARVTPTAVTAASPASADWLASPTVTLELRRAGIASPLADLSSCWIGAVGPIRARRVSVAEVACVAPAHAGARLAPVRLLSDLSAPSVSAESVAVAFTVSADRMDARGRPGGAGAARAPGSLGTPGPSTTDPGMVRFATPRVWRGVAPLAVHGARFPSSGGPEGETVAWCVFQDDARRAYASRATLVSGATARCAPLGSAPLGSAGSGDARRLGRDATTVALGFGVARGAARLELSAVMPEVRSATPRVVPACGGAEVALAGTGFLGFLGVSRLEGVAEDTADDASRAAPSAGCRFGSVGPVAARRASASVATCVSPAKAPSGSGRGRGAHRSRFVPLGFALDPEAHLGETSWGGAGAGSGGGDASAAVLVDGASQSGVAPVALAASGTVAGGAAVDVLGAPLSSRAGEEAPAPRCVFGGDAAAPAPAPGRGGSVGTARAPRVTCLSPPRLAFGGVGFEALRVIAAPRDGGGAFVAAGNAAAPLQFAFAPVPEVTAVFPRRAWGPEVVHVSGAHLASRADGASGAGAVSGPFADNDACVFGGIAAPAKAVSSALVACETRAGADAAAPGGAARASPGRGVVAARGVGPSAVSAFGAGGASPGEDRATTDAALWFVTVPAARPLSVDVEGGWSDGGTLARVTTSLVGDGVPGAPGWLDCAFGSTAVPGRPASAAVSADGYEFGPPPGSRASRSSHLDRDARRAAESADLECVSPAHAPGTVPLELVPAKSKVPSVESAVFFSFA